MHRGGARDGSDSASAGRTRMSAPADAGVYRGLGKENVVTTWALHSRPQGLPQRRRQRDEAKPVALEIMWSSVDCRP